jgi:hypothetical protein
VRLLAAPSDLRLRGSRAFLERVLRGQWRREIFQGLPLGLYAEDRLYDTADDHECGTDEVAGGDLGDVT